MNTLFKVLFVLACGAAMTFVQFVFGLPKIYSPLVSPVIDALVLGVLSGTLAVTGLTWPKASMLAWFLASLGLGFLVYSDTDQWLTTLVVLGMILPLGLPGLRTVFLQKKTTPVHGA